MKIKKYSNNRIFSMMSHLTALPNFLVFRRYLFYPTEEVFRFLFFFSKKTGVDQQLFNIHFTVQLRQYQLVLME